MAPTKTVSLLPPTDAGHWSFAERPAARRVQVGPVSHGTAAGWLCGCRCADCADARPVVAAADHGTIDGYESGCRCGDCGLAHVAGSAGEDRSDIARLADELLDVLEDRLEPWRKQAACVGATEVFFRDTKGRIAADADPRNVCRECPVAADCADYIARRPSRHGVWAATAASERRSTKTAAAAA